MKISIPWHGVDSIFPSKLTNFSFYNYSMFDKGFRKETFFCVRNKSSKSINCDEKKSCQCHVTIGSRILKEGTQIKLCFCDRQWKRSGLRKEVFINWFFVIAVHLQAWTIFFHFTSSLPTEQIKKIKLKIKLTFCMFFNFVICQQSHDKEWKIH